MRASKLRGVVLLSLSIFVACSTGTPPTAERTGVTTFHARRATVSLGEDLRADARKVGIDLRSLIRSDIATVDAALRVPPARVSISYGRGQPATGMGGGTDPFSGDVTITVDRENPLGLKTILTRWLRVPLAHELDHVKRIKDGPGFGSSIALGDAFVFEGLAEAFAADLYPDSVPPSTNSLTKAEEQSFWARATPLLHHRFTREDLVPWFQGGDGLPHWVGYTIGYHIVRSYLRTHSGSTAAAIVTTSATTILGQSAFHPSES